LLFFGVQATRQNELQPIPLSMGAMPQPLPAVTSRLPSLDGWRAVSIAMVLGHHCTFAQGFPYALALAFNVIFDAGLGVRFFFIISGFLITWLMILERDKTGSVSLREFYIRRSLRILPVYVTFLGVLALLDLAGINKQSPAAWIGNLTFTRNSLGTISNGDALSAHLWSLSVEEQFYLAWPVLFFLFGKKGNDRTLLGFLAVTILAMCTIRGLNYSAFNLGGISLQALGTVLSWDSLKYFDSLAFGCASAVLFAHRREVIEPLLKRYSLVAAGLGIALIALPYLSKWLPLRPVAVAQMEPSLQALGFSILILLSLVAPNWGFNRTLNREWVCRVGIWSYSLYIWQQLFWRAPHFLGLDRIWWMGAWILPLFTLAIISYYGLERPFFKLRSRHREVKIQ
jgi:peptidoglycan/LPS O-acetylase OafA/YrhL